jgi:hypothetical protein
VEDEEIYSLPYDWWQQDNGDELGAEFWDGFVARQEKWRGLIDVQGPIPNLLFDPGRDDPRRKGSWGGEKVERKGKGRKGILGLFRGWGGR